MPERILSDDALRAAMSALDGLAMRQELISRNLANVDTPGFRAQTVTFEKALQRAQRKIQTVSLQATHVAHLASPDRAAGVRLVARSGGSLRADGNNVDVDLELTEMVETGIRYQALTELVNKKLRLLKSIARER